MPPASLPTSSSPTLRQRPLPQLILLLVPRKLTASYNATILNFSPSLVITPTTTVQQPATTSDSPAPVGAANAGSNPLGINSNGALTMRQASAPVMVLGAIAAVVALAL